MAVRKDREDTPVKCSACGVPFRSRRALTWHWRLQLRARRMNPHKVCPKCGGDGYGHYIGGPDHGYNCTCGKKNCWPRFVPCSKTGWPNKGHYGNRYWHGPQRKPEDVNCARCPRCWGTGRWVPPRVARAEARKRLEEWRRRVAEWC